MKGILLFSAAAPFVLGTAIAPPPDDAARAAGSRVRLPYDIPLEVPAAPPRPAVVAPAPQETIHWEELDVAPLAPSDGMVAGAPDWNGGAGLIRIVVSLPQQKAFVFRGGELLDVAPVSTGRRGHETPVGTFRIMEKQVHHRSNLYSNAPMPYMQRLTSGGVALHAGHLPGYRASHGCIRLPWGFARKLYGITAPGTPVIVTNERVPVT